MTELSDISDELKNYKNDFYKFLKSERFVFDEVFSRIVPREAIPFDVIAPSIAEIVDNCSRIKGFDLKSLDCLYVDDIYDNQPDWKYPTFQKIKEHHQKRFSSSILKKLQAYIIKMSDSAILEYNGDETRSRLIDLRIKLDYLKRSIPLDLLPSLPEYFDKLSNRLIPNYDLPLDDFGSSNGDSSQKADDEISTFIEKNKDKMWKGLTPSTFHKYFDIFHKSEYLDESNYLKLLSKLFLGKFEDRIQLNFSPQGLSKCIEFFHIFFNYSKIKNLGKTFSKEDKVRWINETFDFPTHATPTKTNTIKNALKDKNRWDELKNIEKMYK